MNHILNKVIIFLCCSVFAISNLGLLGLLIPIIIAIILSSLSSFFSKQVTSFFIFLVFLLISAFITPCLFFIPLFCYDVFLEEFQFLIGLVTLPFLINYGVINGYQLVLIFILALISIILKKQAIELGAAHYRHTRFRDEAEEISAKLESKNKELMEKQDYEVNLATLNERNRIAREIHDNVGHTLSSSILQIGALITISKDEVITENLTVLKDTLSEGMDNIRHSIHNIHEESIDLEATLLSLINNFTFCNATLSYNITNDFGVKAKYSIAYIVKEALSNVMKHSNATSLSIMLTEHPGFYQVIIHDNGTPKTAAARPGSPVEVGMGITSMTNRIATLDGTLTISTEKGFLIFISLPKRRNTN